MSLTAGSTFGAYLVGPLLGAGGMGEVYQARDTRLGRSVALKVLPDAVAHDPDRLARFSREAQALASLNHPRIAQIYGLEEVESRTALVLELVEGPTLADRLLRGPLPLDEALAIATQIAEALEAAHDAGIVHRDLKPANLKITDAGSVKVLDFGLAKIYFDEAAPARDPSLSPTITAAGTGAGVIVGTAAYMSPEQARGSRVDKRADVWAFGCVLFEMLTGRRAFGADTLPDTVVRVLTVEPDLQTLPRSTPPALVSVLKRCLHKDASRRLRDIADARLQIEDVAGGISTASGATSPWYARHPGVGWVVAAVLALIILAIATVAMRRERPDAPALRLSFLTPRSGNAFKFALSPDGRSVVYEDLIDGLPGLWVRSFDQEDGRPLAGTVGADAPFWSPDSRSIGFVADGVLKRIDLGAGFVRTLAPAANMRKAKWGSGNTILFGASAGPLYRVSADGGQVTQATTLLPGQSSHRMPQFLPDGERFLFVSTGTADVRGIYVADLRRPGMHRLVEGDHAFDFLAPSHLLLVKDGALWAQRLNATYTGIEGSMLPVAPHVLVHSTNNGHAALSASAAGSIAYRTSAGQTQLVWVDRTGREVAALTDADDTQWDNVFLSLDGGTVAARRTLNGNTDVWILDALRAQPRRLTFGSTIEGEAVLSRDGRRVVYASDPKAGLWDVYERAADGTGLDTVLIEGPENESPRDVSPDGRYVLVAKQSGTTDFDLWALPLGDHEKPFAVTTTPFAEMMGRFSPDGTLVAFDSNETGQFETFVQSFPRPGPKVQVSKGGGRIPRWRTDGKELYFLTSDGTVMASSVERSGSNVTTGTPRPLFRLPVLQRFVWYAPSVDGKRFLIPKVASADSPLTIVLNWKPPQ